VKRALLVIVALVVMASFCYAADDPKPRATEPLGAVVETGGIIIGKLTNVVEKSFGGGKTENSLVLAEDNGKTKIIPLDHTVTCLDKGFHAITLNQLKGRKVSVQTAGGKVTKVQEK